MPPLQRQQSFSMAACAVALAMGVVAASREVRSEDWATAVAPTRIDEPGRELGGSSGQHGPSPRTLQAFVAFAERSHPKLRAAWSYDIGGKSRDEVTFLSLLQAQRILTETELAFVESHAERWNGAVAVADLLQLEVFPPTDDVPAAAPADFHDELGAEGGRVGRDPNQPPLPRPQPPGVGLPVPVQPPPEP